MMVKYHNSHPVESENTEGSIDSSDVADPRGKGISARKYPDPDYTTYEETVTPLTAPVQLPSQESITVKLAPINLVDRLEEYHSDENLGYSIFGVLLGAAFGVIVNWSTDPNQPASAISIVMFIFYLLIAGGILVWLIRIRNRKRDVKEEMDRSST